MNHLPHFHVNGLTRYPFLWGLVLLMLVSICQAHGGISSIGGLLYIYLMVMMLAVVTTLWLGFLLWLLCKQELTDLAIKRFRWMVYLVLAGIFVLLVWMVLAAGWDGQLVAMALGVTLGVVIITELEILLGRNWRQ